MTTITATQNLVVTTCWCGMMHAVPEDLRDFQLRQHRDGKKPTGIYCPLGHSHIPAGEGEAKRLERELQRERQRHDQTRSELCTRTASLVKATTESKKLKKRVANGVCPCCKRSFCNLARHMKTKHPSYVEAAK